MKDLDTSIRLYRESTSREALSGFLKATFTKYGMEDKIDEAIKVIQAESGWNIFAVGDDGTSKGILQYQKATWNENCLEFSDYESLDPYAQIGCLAKMWDRKMEYRWTTWCRMFGKNEVKCNYVNGK